VEISASNVAGDSVWDRLAAAAPEFGLP